MVVSLHNNPSEHTFPLSVQVHAKSILTGVKPEWAHDVCSPEVVERLVGYLIAVFSAYEVGELKRFTRESDQKIAR